MGSESEISVLLKIVISRLILLLIILSLYLSVPSAWAQSLLDHEGDQLWPNLSPYDTALCGASLSAWYNLQNIGEFRSI
jgi:hypothetical protein